MHYRWPQKLKDLFYHLKLHSHKGISFLLPAIPVIMIQVPSTVPKIRMIFYTKFLYAEGETKTCLQEINKNNGLSQVMLRSTVYTQHKTRQFFSKAAGWISSSSLLDSQIDSNKTCYIHYRTFCWQRWSFCSDSMFCLRSWMQLTTLITPKCWENMFSYFVFCTLSFPKW